ncbi:zinc finger MYM-type protein 1-like [Homarus americanus]|uniref:zinc finger MYM-type protein 1-like n=1 Tax=Homarus americanus TaxID=6706 RepID=UPI001C491847|nr:zinc finger MYM-type protein 1-like [Homarus americanus]
MSSKNPGVFRGLVDFACELDSSLDAHLKTATVFKGTSKSIQNELLESMLEICKNKIKEETAEALSSVLHKELQTLIGDCPHKLIAQTYDGAAPLSGVNKGVQTRIKEVYINAHFIHCYAHQLNLILGKATSQNTNVRVFFNSLSGIPAFFSKSPQRMAALENVAGHRIPRPSATRWNFKSRTVNAVHEMKDALIECCSTLEASNSRETGSAAAGIKRIVNDPEFEFWLEFFSKVMPHVDIMFSQLQSRNIDAAKANASLKVFNSAVQKLRDECDAMVLLLPPEQKRKFKTDKLVAAKEQPDGAEEA